MNTIVIKALQRLIVIVWRPLEHISPLSSKTVGDGKVFGNILGNLRNILRWHSHGAVVNAKACRSASLYVPDRPIDRLFFALTLLENALVYSGHSKTAGNLCGRTRCKLGIKVGVVSSRNLPQNRCILSLCEWHYFSYILSRRFCVLQGSYPPYFCVAVV